MWRGTGASFHMQRKLRDAGAGASHALQHGMFTDYHVARTQHIQGIAIDAARSNVDHHYLYICDAYNSFMQTHTAQVSLLLLAPRVLLAPARPRRCAVSGTAQIQLVRATSRQLALAAIIAAICIASSLVSTLMTCTPAHARHPRQAAAHSEILPEQSSPPPHWSW